MPARPRYATAAEQDKAGVDRLMTATGRAYAEKLSIGDLRVPVAFNEGYAGKRWRAEPVSQP